MQVNLGDARDQLSQLVQKVLNGEQVTICKNGEPVVDLVRTEHKKRDAPKFGTLKGKIAVNDPNWGSGLQTKEELEAWLNGKL